MIVSEPTTIISRFLIKRKAIQRENRVYQNLCRSLKRNGCLLHLSHLPFWDEIGIRQGIAFPQFWNLHYPVVAAERARKDFPATGITHHMQLTMKTNAKKELKKSIDFLWWRKKRSAIKFPFILSWSSIAICWFISLQSLPRHINSELYHKNRSFIPLLDVGSVFNVYVLLLLPL